jgi:DNA-binding transcriptional ArsR family regulator
MDSHVGKLLRNDVEDVLKGTTLKVYRFVLKSKGPVGIRETQRGLKLSSPTLASYHLEKLREAGLLKQCIQGYKPNQVFLKTLIRLRGILIPRYFFYSVFFISALIVELVIFKPSILTREYFFAVGVIFVASVAFIYETVRTLLKEGI